MQTSIYPQPTLPACSLTQRSSSNQLRFPEDIQVILRADRADRGNFYLGNIEAAQNAALLESLKIGAVMCVARGRATAHSKDIVKHSKYIPLQEDQAAQLGQYLEEGVGFIAQKLQTTNVLVHCVAGNSRAACFAIAFLMRRNCLSLQDAYTEVKSRRRVISLTEHMLAQLKMFEKGMKDQIVHPNTQKTDRGDNSVMVSIGERSIRIKMNAMNRSNLLAVDEQSNLNISRITGSKVNVSQEEGRSIRSNKSGSSKASMSKVSVLNHSSIPKNPQESFISKHSQTVSMLNKSFSSHRRAASQVFQLEQLPELQLKKKASSSREEFTLKVNALESRNSAINQQIHQLQAKFQSQKQSSRMALEAQLNEISRIRNRAEYRELPRKRRKSSTISLQIPPKDDSSAQQLYARIQQRYG